MAAEPVIRWAKASDAAIVHRLLQALAESLGQSDKFSCTVADISRFGLEEQPVFRALLAETNDTPVGLCLFFTSFSSWRGQPGIYVQDLYVAPAWRRSRLGQRLLGHAAAYGRQHGCTYLRLSVDSSNKSGRRFYHRLGFIWSRQERIQQLSDEAFTAFAETDSPLPQPGDSCS